MHFVFHVFVPSATVVLVLLLFKVFTSGITSNSLDFVNTGLGTHQSVISRGWSRPGDCWTADPRVGQMELSPTKFHIFSYSQ